MNSFASHPWVLAQGEAAMARLEGIERHTLRTGAATLALTVGLPASYVGIRRRRYPLVVLVQAVERFGSAVEMSRLLASSREVQACIVVNVQGATATDATALAGVVTECRRRYRVVDAAVAVFAEGKVLAPVLRAHAAGIEGVTHAIVASAKPMLGLLADLPAARAGTVAWTTLTEPVPDTGVRWKTLPEAVPAGLMVPALMHGLRCFWPSGHRYGDEVMPLAQPVLHRIALALKPLMRRLAGRPVFAPDYGGRHVIRAQAMDRDFEVFVSLPASAIHAGDSGRRYPTLFAVDANAGFATVAETVAALAQAGDIDEMVVIGVGTPRAQGDLEFGFRRFEEFAPPASVGYAWDDPLGRFFRSLYALRGQDARVQLTQAPPFLDFLVRELLPRLSAQLPIDERALTLLGHSAGGTFVAYALTQPQSPFAHYLCLSPGVSISGGWMMQHAKPARPGARIFIALGSEELGNPFNRIAGIPQTLDYANALRRSHGDGALPCAQLDGETHTTVYARALAQGLCALEDGRQ